LLYHSESYILYFASWEDRRKDYGVVFRPSYVTFGTFSSINLKWNAQRFATREGNKNFNLIRLKIAFSLGVYQQAPVHSWKRESFHSLAYTFTLFKTNTCILYTKNLQSYNLWKWSLRTLLFIRAILYIINENRTTTLSNKRWINKSDNITWYKVSEN
jgi:hypothetical protein